MKNFLFSITILTISSFLIAEEVPNSQVLLAYSRKQVRNGQIPNKRKRHLAKYVADILSQKTGQAYKPVADYNGDFGVPAKLPNKKLQDFLLYSMGHYRQSYPMLGRQAHHLNIRFEWQVEALTDLYYYYDDTKAKDCAVNILQYAVRHIETLDTQSIREKITEDGARNLWHPLMINAAKYYGQLYELTKREKYAEKAIAILIRFGEVFPKWKIYYRNSPFNPLKTGEIFISENNPAPYNLGYGYMGNWGDVHDLLHFRTLLYTYVRVKNSKTYKKDEHKYNFLIKRELLEKIVERNLLFPFRPLHNQSPNRIIGIASFGKYLNNPKYIHQAIDWTLEIFHIGFRADGMWSEGTPSYAYGMLVELRKTKRFLNGWSDPGDYRPAKGEKSLKNFNFEKYFGKYFQRAENAIRKLMLPNARTLALEDSIWNAKYNFSPPVSAKPFLLGNSGIGMLGFGNGIRQVRLYLHWEGINNHDHYDGLGFTLWANDEEISSETAYRGLNVWNRSTQAHNTVVVDNHNQVDFRAAPCIKKFSDKLANYPHYQFGKLGGRESKYDDAGRLMLWDSSSELIQVAQVSGEKYYRNSKEYMRTMILVKVNEKDFYIVDQFNVTGGNIHDYMLHGNLEKNYKIILPKAEEYSTTMGRFLKSLSQLKTSNSFSVIFKSNSENSLKSTFAGYLATNIIIAKGPSIRLNGEPSAWNKFGENVKTKFENSSEYMVIRRKGPVNTFVAVHEITKGNHGIIKDVRFKDNKITVKTSSREDNFEIVPERVHAKLGEETFSFGKVTVAGNVLVINSVDKGAVDNSFVLSGKCPEVDLRGKVIFIIDGARHRLPYIIKAAKTISSKKFKVIVNQETGVSMQDGSLIMNFYPNWDIPGNVTYQINCLSAAKKIPAVSGE